jgi:predicted hydrocarbon binding protein
LGRGAKLSKEGEKMGETFMKGSTVISTLEFLRERGTLQKVLANLQPPHEEYFTGRVLPSSLCPARTFSALLDQVCQVHGDDALATCYEIGRRIVNDGLQSVYQVFLRRGSPLWVLRRSPGLWRSYFKNSDIEILEAEGTHGTLKVVEKHHPSEADCETRRGGIAETLHLAGARQLEVVHSRCRARGDTECVFEIRWKNPA